MDTVRRTSWLQLYEKKYNPKNKKKRIKALHGSYKTTIRNPLVVDSLSPLISPFPQVYLFWNDAWGLRVKRRKTTKRLRGISVVEDGCNIIIYKFCIDQTESLT